MPVAEYLHVGHNPGVPKPGNPYLSLAGYTTYSDDDRDPTRVKKHSPRSRNVVAWLIWEHHAADLDGGKPRPISYEDIAESLDIGRGTAESYVSEARAFFRAANLGSVLDESASKPGALKSAVPSDLQSLLTAVANDDWSVAGEVLDRNPMGWNALQASLSHVADGAAGGWAEELTAVIASAQRHRQPRRRARVNLPVSASAAPRQVVELLARVVAEKPIVLLRGLGQAALTASFVKAHLEEYDIVAGIDAQEPKPGYLTLEAELFGTSIASTGDARAERLREFLGTCDERWLLLVERAESVSQVGELVPLASNGTLIISGNHDIAASDSVAVFEIADAEPVSTSVEHLLADPPASDQPDGVSATAEDDPTSRWVLPGFTELLPEDHLAEQALVSSIRRQVELFGFTAIETPAIERPVSGQLERSAEYQPFRVLSDVARPGEELTLRSDLTVPLAHYVSANADDLVFPFRRYQIQPVFRDHFYGGFHESRRCDVDVVGINSLDRVYDAEIVAVIHSVFGAIEQLPPVKIHVSNRRILDELLSRLLGPEEARGRREVLLIIGRARRTGDEAMKRDLVNTLGATDAQVVTALLESTGTNEATRILRPVDAEAGVVELKKVIERSHALGVPADRVVADYRVVRDFDYYSGTVYETYLEGEDWPSVCFGGRYDHLTVGGDGPDRRRFPGVGVSIDTTQLFEWMRKAGVTSTSRKSAAEVVVTMDAGATHRDAYLETAGTLRAGGLKTELHFEREAPDLLAGRADRLGVPVLVHADSQRLESGCWTVRDTRTGAEVDVLAAELVGAVRSALAKARE
jgi:histidyl-tRNA synthetase